MELVTKTLYFINSNTRKLLLQQCSEIICEFANMFSMNSFLDVFFKKNQEAQIRLDIKECSPWPILGCSVGMFMEASFST